MATILARMAEHHAAPQFADLDDVRDQAAGMSIKWATCRARGHSMVDHLAKMADDEQGYEITLRCSRCSTKKRQFLDLRGCIVGGEYEYPEGYTFPAGTGRLDSEGRGIFRLTVLQAKLEHQAAQQERRARKKSA